MHDAPFLVRQSAICLSLFIRLSFISLIADISTRCLRSDIWLVVLALSCKDLLHVIICEVGEINDNS